jgi:hypothetical protein
MTPGAWRRINKPWVLRMHCEDYRIFGTHRKLFMQSGENRPLRGVLDQSAKVDTDLAHRNRAVCLLWGTPSLKSDHQAANAHGASFRAYSRSHLFSTIRRAESWSKLTAANCGSSKLLRSRHAGIEAVAHGESRPLPRARLSMRRRRWRRRVALSCSLPLMTNE